MATEMAVGNEANSDAFRNALTIWTDWDGPAGGGLRQLAELLRIPGPIRSDARILLTGWESDDALVTRLEVYLDAEVLARLKRQACVVRKPLAWQDLVGSLEHEPRSERGFRRSVDCLRAAYRVRQSFSSSPWELVIVDDESESLKAGVLTALQSVGIDKVDIKLFDAEEAQAFADGDPDSALTEAVANRSIDAFLIDLFLPLGHVPTIHPSNLDGSALLGLRVLNRIHEFRPRGRVIAVTKIAGDEAVIKSIQNHADWHISKDRLYRLGPALLNLYGNITLPSVSSMPPSFPTVNYSPEVSGEQSDTTTVLKALFPKASILDVRRASDGRSGGEVLFVRPSAGPRTDSVKVVKVDSAGAMRSEKNNFDEIVDKRGIANYVGRVEGRLREAGGKAAIMYSAVGLPNDYSSPDRYPVTLAQYLRDQNTGSESAVFRRLFDLLSSIYRDAHNSDVVPIDYYRWVLPDDLCAHVASPAQSAAGPTATADPGKICTLEPDDNFVVMNGQVLERHTRKLKISVSASGSIAPRPADAPILLKVQIDGPEGNPLFERLIDDPRLDPGKMLGLPRGLSLICTRNKYDHLKAIARHTFDMLIGATREDGLASGLRIGTQEYRITDPIAYLGHLEESRDVMPLRMSFVHGDLNLWNVLVTDRSRPDPTCWLIDFAKTRYGHTAFDWAKLETEIKTQMLSEAIADAVSSRVKDRRVSLESALGACLVAYHIRESGETAFVDDKSEYEWLLRDKSYQKVWGLIDRLRETALESIGVTEREYFLSLFMYSLAALKFENLARLQFSSRDWPIPRALAFLSASAMAGRLIAMGLTHPDAPSVSGGPPLAV